MNEVLTGFEALPWGVLLPLLAVNLVLMIIALLDCARADKTNGPKALWILIIIFINLLGPVLYFVLGRRNNG